MGKRTKSVRCLGALPFPRASPSWAGVSGRQSSTPFHRYRLLPPVPPLNGCLAAWVAQVAPLGRPAGGGVRPLTCPKSCTRRTARRRCHDSQRSGGRLKRRVLAAFSLSRRCQAAPVKRPVMSNVLGQGTPNNSLVSADCASGPPCRRALREACAAELLTVGHSGASPVPRDMDCRRGWLVSPRESTYHVTRPAHR